MQSSSRAADQPRAARVALATVVGVVGFYAFAALVRTAATHFGAGKLGAHAGLKLALVALSLAVWAAMRRSFRSMGFARSRPIGRGAWRWYALAALGMGGATIAMILSDARHPLTAGTSFPQIILSVWVLSSVSEEIFVRGLLQSSMAGADGLDLGSPLVVAASALAFSAMHLSLIWSGAGWLGGGPIVLATFVVGWSAAELRARTGSLLHPILVHVFGNVIAVPFGVIGVILYRLIHGTLPAIAS